MDSKDLNIFLMVAKHGSTLAASKQLQVSQSTVARRIESLEKSLGLSLFDKQPSGYELTEAGRALVPQAEAVERAVASVLSSAAEQKRGVGGLVRFTTLEAFGQTFIVPAMREFREAYPDIRIDLIATEAVLDLTAGEADVALRTGTAPTAAGIVGRKIGRDGWGVYCARSYAERFGVPKTAEDLRDHHVISLSKDFRRAPLIVWFDEVVPESAMLLRQHNIPGLLAGLKSGAGVTLMSDMVASTDETLVRCFSPPMDTGIDIWLLTTERLRHEPRIRTLIDFLARYFAKGRYRAVNG